MQGEYIKKEAWDKILIFLKDAKGVYLCNEKNCKFFFEAIYWIVRTGAQWRELPERYGNWNTIYKRFNAWSRRGIWEKFFRYCVQEPDLEYIMLDSTIVRAHACSAGYGQQEAEALGRSRGGFSTKIHAKVDALGNPLMFVLTPGQSADVNTADELLSDAANAYILGDRAYDTDHIREQIKKNGCTAVIPPKRNRKCAFEFDDYIYKERHQIECFFSKIKFFRRLFSRFEKTMRNFLSMLNFVGACIWLR